MKLLLTPAWSWLQDAPPEVYRQIDDAMSFEMPGLQHSEKMKKLVRMKVIDGKVHIFNRLNGKFPTGLAEKVLELLPGDVELEDRRFDLMPTSPNATPEDADLVNLKGISLSDDQRAAVKAALERKRGLLLLATNFGKSEVIIAISEILSAAGLKTLWLVHRKDLLKQCADRYRERTGNEPGVWGSKEKTVGDYMTIAMVQSIPSQGKGAWLKQFHVLAVDECVHASSNTWFSVCQSCEAPYRFGLTGALPEEKLRQYRIMGVSDAQILHRAKNLELIESGWSAKPTIHLRHLAYKPNRMRFRMAYDKMVRFNRQLAVIIANETKMWADQGKTVLVIVDRLAQGNHVTSELAGLGINAEFIHGSLPEEIRTSAIDRLRHGALKVIVATSIFDEGVDVPAIDTLILGACGKSHPRQLQRMGRALRRKPGENEADIVDYIFDGNATLLSHSLGRIDLCEKEGFKIVWPETKIEVEIADH